MTALNNVSVRTRDRELVMSRVFDSPQDLVFEVWAEPKHLANWAVPGNFTMAFCEVDFREGGSYRFCMSSTEGEDHWIWGTYSEIVETERIVFTLDNEELIGGPRSTSVVSVTFSAIGEKTKMTLRHGVFEFADDFTEHRTGWTECLDRLARYVETA